MRPGPQLFSAACSQQVIPNLSRALSFGIFPNRSPIIRTTFDLLDQAVARSTIRKFVVAVLRRSCLRLWVESIARILPLLSTRAGPVNYFAGD
jgi:hypothetical protein